MSEFLISPEGFSKYNIWEHSKEVEDLYLQRAKKLVDEMDCASQAAALLKELSEPGDVLLDAGCGSGYFYHSILNHNIDIQYFGFDACQKFINIGKKELSRYGLPPQNLSCYRIEDIYAKADHVLCMNVLSNIDNFHKPLERLLHIANKSLILRESLSDKTSYKYVRDNYLDDGVNLNVHINTYAKKEIKEFIQNYGFKVDEVIDNRTQGRAENVIGYPHYWTFLIAKKEN